MEQPAPWWSTAVTYQVYPRSFADTDGDGIGDLRGITAHLDHLSWLGVDALWLSPFYPSPLDDGGYDISDFCDVDPRLGTLDDLDDLVAAAHARGLRVVVDHVPNHTSDRHPWFEASRSSRDDPRRDWYWWRDGRAGRTGDGAPGGDADALRERPPTNWRATFTGERTWRRRDDGQLRPVWSTAPGDGAPSWTRDDATGQWYLHTFLASQPDLNWRTPEVREAMAAVLRFWVDRGVDGFRVDAVRSVAKRVPLRDLPAALAGRPQAALDDPEAMDEVIASMRRVLAGTDRELMLVGEVHADDVEGIVAHVGAGLFTQAFDFPLMGEPWEAPAWRRQIDAALAARAGRSDARLSWVLSNHDEPRVAERFGSEARARAALVATLMLPGSAFLYMGDELGLRDATVPEHRRVDPAGRDGPRAPLPWSATPDRGWPADPWLPFPSNADGHDVATQRADPTSTLHLTRALLAERRTVPAAEAPALDWVEAPDGVLAFRRVDPPGGLDRERLVVVNTTDEAVSVDAGRGWVVAVSASAVAAAAGGRFDGRLGPDDAVVLHPPPG